MLNLFLRRAQYSFYKGQYCQNFLPFPPVFPQNKEPKITIPIGISISPASYEQNSVPIKWPTNRIDLLTCCAVQLTLKTIANLLVRQHTLSSSRDERTGGMRLCCAAVGEEDALERYLEFKFSHKPAYNFSFRHFFVRRKPDRIWIVDRQSTLGDSSLIAPLGSLAGEVGGQCGNNAQLN